MGGSVCWTLYSVPLVYLSILMPLQCLNYYRLVIGLDILFFFKIALAILDPMRVYINFRISLLVPPTLSLLFLLYTLSLKKLPEIYIRVTLKL